MILHIYNMNLSCIGEIRCNIENAGKIHAVNFSSKNSYLTSWERLTAEKTKVVVVYISFIDLK
jgi:hypothetical protein